MSEYNHIDEKQYIIAEGLQYRVWNSGIIETYFYGRWEELNPNQSQERRLEFLKCWEKAVIGKKYDFNWIYNEIYRRSDGIVKFLGFKIEECPECKQSNLIWEGKIQLCKNCEYIHAFEYDDS